MNERTTESWKPIAGYKGAYEVSDLGRVRSLDRHVYAGPSGMRLHKGRVLSIHAGDHYSKVRLKLAGGGSTKNVHSLVAEAFIGPRPAGTEVCHNNGRHHDNRLINLRYDTHVANALERAMHGADPNARRTHCNQGHEFTPANTLRRTGENESGRRCRACERARSKRRTSQETIRAQTDRSNSA